MEKCVAKRCLLVICACELNCNCGYLHKVCTRLGPKAFHHGGGGGRKRRGVNHLSFINVSKCQFKKNKGQSSEI